MTVLDRPRLHSLTERVESKFGTMHVACNFDDRGHVRGISISYPGKHMAKEVGDALDALNDGFNRLIEELNAAK